MPPIALGRVTNVVVDVGAWFLIHAGTGYAVHRLPLRRLQRDTWLLRPRRIERAGRLYERLAIKRWKDALPEAGAFFRGGMSKRELPGTTVAGLTRFASETRRAEYGHWLALAGGPLFVLWNPPAIAAVMMVYAVLANAPFIAIQRYNRLRVARCLERESRSASRSATDRRTRRRFSVDINGNSIP